MVLGYSLYIMIKYFIFALMPIFMATPCIALSTTNNDRIGQTYAGTVVQCDDYTNNPGNNPGNNTGNMNRPDLTYPICRPTLLATENTCYICTQTNPGYIHKIPTDCKCQDDEFTESYPHTLSDGCVIKLTRCAKKEPQCNPDEKAACESEIKACSGDNATQKCPVAWTPVTGKNYKRREIAVSWNDTQCECIKQEYFRCNDGYYGAVLLNTETGEYNDCTRCPNIPGDTNADKWASTTYNDAQYKTIYTCFMPQNTEIKDERGTFTYTNNCCYKDQNCSNELIPE